MRFSLLVPALIACALPGTLRAQSPDCELLYTPTTRGSQLRPQGMTYLGGGVRFVCTGGISISSDSVAHIESAGLIEFIGNVHYADTAKTLEAGYAQYIGQSREVLARDNVVLKDLKTGSTILAPYLNYFQASETRPEPQVVIYSGRPRAILMRAPREGGPPDSTIVDSDAMEIHGERLFIGRGNVVMTRGAMQAFGHEAFVDQASDSLRFAGNARVVTDAYRLNGDTISAMMTEEEEFRDVYARGNAHLESDDLQVDAPELRVFFDAGVVNRLIAVGDTRVPGGARAPGRRRVAGTGVAEAALTGQARAISRDFKLLADSIDALAPGQRLEKVIAVGSAFGERMMPDSVAGDSLHARPEGAERDWMRGDTIIATFISAPVAADTAGEERLLDAISALGGVVEARSLYAIPNREDPKAPLSLSYVIAQRIDVKLLEGEVEDVRAWGKDGQPVHGIYLQPDGTGRREASESGPPGSSR